MHPTAERLYQAAHHLRATTGQSAVARLLNESPQTVKNWESRGISKAGAIKAQAEIGCSASWLLSGEGSMAVEQVPATAQAPAQSVASLTPSPAPWENAIQVPLLANAGSMGQGTDVQHEDVIMGTIALSPEWIVKRLHPSAPQALRFIHAYGDSMAPTFEDGDVLLVDTGARDPAIDGVYVLEAHRRIFIKRVRQRMDGSYEVSSDNPNVKTVDVLNGDHAVDVLGRVVWAWNGKKL